MKICLIGSTRFLDKYYETNRRLSLMGHVVYSVATPSSDSLRKTPTTGNLTDDEKETLDLVHLLKLQNSDVACLITDDKGYVGFSTKREIKWCLLTGKQILLPEHFKGIGENMDGLMKGIQEAIRELKNEGFRSKFDVGNIKI